MRKTSLMGSSEFEFEPWKLEEKINKREAFYNNAFININNYINAHAKNYQKKGLGCANNFKEEMLKRLIKDFRGIK